MNIDHLGRGLTYFGGFGLLFFLISIDVDYQGRSVVAEKGLGYCLIRLSANFSAFSFLLLLHLLILLLR